MLSSVNFVRDGLKMLHPYALSSFANMMEVVSIRYRTYKGLVEESMGNVGFSISYDAAIFTMTEGSRPNQALSLLSRICYVDFKDRHPMEVSLDLHEMYYTSVSWFPAGS